MTFSELKDKLTIHSRRAVIGAGLLTPNIDTMLARLYGGGQLVVTDAADGGTGSDRCVITGLADFLNCTGLQTVLTAWVDGDGSAQLLVAYRLLGALVTAGDWKFSRSFPDFPQNQGTPYLDRLQLRDASYLVASCARPADGEHPALIPGVNFSGKLKPDSILGPLAFAMNPQSLLDVSGVLIPVDPAEKTRPLKPLEHPWDIVAAGGYCPGIFLSVPMEQHQEVGAIRFDLDRLNIYVPSTAEWFAKNRDYFPFFTYMGRLTVDSLGIGAAFCADYSPDGGEIVMPIEFTGISLKNLASLADFSGGCDLLGGLPAQLRSLPLGKLELTAAVLWLSVAQNRLRLPAISLTVGLPGLRWQIWPEHFCVECIFATFSLSDPFGDSALSCRVSGRVEVGGVALDVGASDEFGFTLYSQLAQELDIPIQSLLSRYLPQIAAPCDLSVQELGLAVSPGRDYQLSLRMANEPRPWVIDLGFRRLTIRDVFLYGVYAAGGSVTGHVGGTLAFGDIAELSVLYQTPGNLVMRARFPSVRLSEILSVLCNEEFSFPNGFDLHFTDSSVLIEKSGAAYHFLFGTQVEGFGVLALEVRKNGDGWGAAIGLDVAGGRASQLPSLGALALFESVFSLDNLLFVASSFSDVGFSFPDMGRFENPILAGGSLTLPGGGVIAGLNFYGRWTINTADPKQALLRKILGLNPSVGVTLQVGKNPGKELRLSVDYTATIAGHPLVCKFGGQIRDGSVGLFLEGSLDVEIQGHIQTFVVALDFVANGAYLAATNKSGVPIDYGVFQLGNLAVEVGFSWEGIPSFGVAGTISSGSFHSSVAVFFDSAQPAKSLVAGAVSDLSLKDVFDTFLQLFARQSLTMELSDIYGILELFAIRGTKTFSLDAALADDLDSLNLTRVAEAFAKENIIIPSSMESVFLTVAEPGKTWFLTDLNNKMRHYQLKKATAGGRIQASVEAQLYCAPQQTHIGALPVFQQGFYVNACLVFFGYKVIATVEIDSGKGFSLEAQMDKIVIFSETLFCVGAARGPGGPVVSAATYGDPHLYVNGKVSVLGLETAVFLNANKHGLVFDINQSFLSVIRLNVHGTIGGLSYLNIGGSVNVGIGSVDLGPLGRLHIDSGVNGALDISVGDGKASATLDSGFRLLGNDHKLAKFNLDVNTGSLANLPKVLWEKVKEYLKKFFQDAESWAYHVAKGVIEGIVNMVSVLCDVFGLLLEEAKSIVTRAFELAQMICPITTALKTL